MERMYHPELEAEAPVVSREVFELAWAERGWELVDDEPEPEPELTEVTAEDVAATTVFVPSSDPTAENPDGYESTIPDAPFQPDAPSDPDHAPDTGEEDH